MRYQSTVACLLALGLAACQADGPTAPPAEVDPPPRLSQGPASPLDVTLFDFTLRESIPIPSSGNVGVYAVRDMDGDGVLDILLFNHSSRIMTILERSGSGFVTRFTENTGDIYTALRVGDVDGDGIPEIGAKSSYGGWFRVYESTGDNAYARTHHTSIGRYPESVHIGDSDGNGRLEFLIARETFPSRVHRFEGTGDNVYTRLYPEFGGGGGDVWLAGVSDLDGDGAPETVYSNNQYYRVPDWRTRADVYVMEGGSMVYSDPSGELKTTTLGDFDGNGLGEILGVDSRNGNMKILESTGSGNGFQVVYSAPPSGYSWYAIDADANGVSELWRALQGESSQKDVFAFGRRAGGTFTDIYESGALLQAFAGDIRGMFTTVDTNGDGGDEVVVVQGNLVHVLELSGTLTVAIDIKPGSDPNSINTKSRGNIPVAILSTEAFDAPGEVDPESLTFGRTGDEASLARCGRGGEDVNDDGLADLVCHFTTQETGFARGDTEGVLKGQTLGGKPLEGRDAVRIVK